MEGLGLNLYGRGRVLKIASFEGPMILRVPKNLTWNLKKAPWKRKNIDPNHHEFQVPMFWGFSKLHIILLTCQKNRIFHFPA